MVSTKKSGGRIAFVAAVLALALALVPVALAGKPSGGGSGSGGGGHKGGGSSGSNSLTLVMVADQNGNGLPNWGDTITFNVSTGAANPYVSVRCYQNGVLVYSADAGFYPSYPWPGARNMPLYSPSWTGGAATCTAVLNDGIATLNFDVGA